MGNTMQTQSRIKVNLNHSCFHLKGRRSALDNSTFEPDAQVAIAGTILGIVLGIGAPIFYASRDEADEKRLREIRALNRATKEATGEYMSEQELYTIRPPKWTDRREFVDDD